MSQDQDKFPETLDYVDPSERLPKALGWQLGAWGGYLLIAGCWLLGQKNMPFWASLLAFLPGAGLIYREAARRKNRTTVCVRGSRIGIYRQGKFDMEVGVSAGDGTISAAPGDFINKIDKGLDALNHFRITVVFILMPLVGVMVGAIPLLSMLHPRTGEYPSVDWLDLAAGTGLSVASIISILSIIWVRHFHKLFLLPRKTGSAEDFWIPRSQAQRFTAGQA